MGNIGYTKPVDDLIKTVFKLNQNTSLVETYKELVAKTEGIMSGCFAMPSIEGLPQRQQPQTEPFGSKNHCA